MKEQNHGRTNESNNRLAVIVVASSFLVAFGTAVGYVPAWFWEQWKMIGSWLPEMLLFSVQLAGHSLWDCVPPNAIGHWLTVSVASTMVLGVVIGLAAAWRRRATL
jgi:hypothetical protein